MFAVQKFVTTTLKYVVGFYIYHKPEVSHRTAAQKHLFNCNKGKVDNVKGKAMS